MVHRPLVCIDASDGGDSRDQTGVFRTTSDAPKGIIGGMPATDAPREYSMN